jgi:hypothetical protein
MGPVCTMPNRRPWSRRASCARLLRQALTFNMPRIYNRLSRLQAISICWNTKILQCILFEFATESSQDLPCGQEVPRNVYGRGRHQGNR